MSALPVAVLRAATGSDSFGHHPDAIRAVALHRIRMC
jgi:hypothetical protein